MLSFRSLGPESIALIQERSASPVGAEALRKLASRVGAPVVDSPADVAALEVLRQGEKGHRPRKAIARLLTDSLGGSGEPVSDAARSVSRWIGVSPKERGEALVDLLLLADYLPAPGREAETPRFPRLEPV